MEKRLLVAARNLKMTNAIWILSLCIGFPYWIWDQYGPFFAVVMPTMMMLTIRKKWGELDNLGKIGIIIVNINSFSILSHHFYYEYMS